MCLILYISLSFFMLAEWNKGCKIQVDKNEEVGPN